MKKSSGRVGAFEAKTHLAELLRQTENGKSFVIHRRGKPAANGMGSATLDQKIATAEWSISLRESLLPYGSTSPVRTHHGLKVTNH